MVSIFSTILRIMFENLMHGSCFYRYLSPLQSCIIEFYYLQETAHEISYVFDFVWQFTSVRYYLLMLIDFL